MRLRFAWRSAARRLLPLALLAALVLAGAPSLGQNAASGDSAAIEAAKVALDRIENTLGRGELSAKQLGDLRAALAETRDALRAKLEDLEPRMAEAEERLKQLGPPPPKDAPAEPAALAAEREDLSRAFSALDGAVKQSRLLLVRSDQLAERITARRHALYAREILERSPSVLDLSFWHEAVGALPEEFGKLGTVVSAWSAAADEKGRAHVAAALVCIAGLLLAARLIRRWWRRRYANGVASDTRFAKARKGLWVFISVAAPAPIVTAAALQVLDLFGLWTPQIEEIAAGLVAGVAVAAFGRGAALGLFAPERPERRLLAMDHKAAVCLAEHLVWSARIFGAAIVLQIVHKAVVTPLVLTIATNALFALAIAALLVHLIFRLRRLEEELDGATTAAPWVRLLGWVIVATLAAALVTGYAGLAAFIALRTVVAAALGCALYIWLVAADALFTEALSPETPRGRAIAANLGIPPRNAGLIGTLLSAAIRIVLVVLVVAVIVGPWEASTADLFESVQSMPLGFKIGEINVSFRGLLSAILALIVVLVATRIAQRWLEVRFLPQTTLEPSLQLSIVTIFGYLGIITAVALALGALGIDLQKIALVAGALSVGIGFGLQSIVSNFVSGLILLAERPIRVGDSIVVKGEEGWVRRIRVRATEIETFERASVIIPNSELITGLVKNWTHANTMGRVIIKVGVSYDSDPDQVRELLEKIANDHPQVVQSPPPRAFLLGFGDSALEFDLRCVVANVEHGLAVRSDLHFAILKAFREAGIEIPFPQCDVRVREAQTEARSGPPARRSGANAS
ncbi:MAG: mechanosensitive ion channel family protein [Variibacter sp.]|nr:mechanosensitive ion channel family protein [Variibacter sp.]